VRSIKSRCVSVASLHSASTTNLFCAAVIFGVFI
jgi:hypothetical protein